MAFTEYDTLPSTSCRTDVTASTAMLAKKSFAVPMILDDIAVYTGRRTPPTPHAMTATSRQSGGYGTHGHILPWRASYRTARPAPPTHDESKM